jgi:hypothetical protein
VGHRNLLRINPDKLPLWLLEEDTETDAGHEGDQIRAGLRWD